MNEKVSFAINQQINNELSAAYLYLSMAAYFESVSLTGFAHWMRKQSDEEREHAMKLFDFMNDRDSRVKLKEVEQPKSQWENPMDVHTDALNHEKKVTTQINSIFEIAMEEKDYATISFLQWFLNEQVEEEATAQQIVDKLQLIGDDNSALYIMDKEMAARNQ